MAVPIRPIVDPAVRVQVLSADDVARIHEATLEVIETVGVRFPSEEALDLWARHGATVDRSSGVVRAPRRLIEEALKLAPPVYDLAARDPSQDLPLDGRHVHAATDGCGVEVFDIETGERRRSALRDVADIARVADALDEVSFHWIPVSAQDVPARARGLHELAACWRNSTKHVQTESIVTVHEAEGAVEMAAAIAGGRDALRRRPVLSIMQCTTSPLGQDGGSVEAGLVAARAGVPVGFMTMASCAFTGPVTIAGSLVVGNAEVISALALMQLEAPGCPVYYAAAQTAMDLRSGAYTGGGPEDFLFGGATNALADFYNVPLSMGSFATGAKLPDWQAGIENSLSTFMASAAVSDMLLGLGLLNGSRIFSFEQLLMDAEIFSIVRATLAGIPVTDDTLALDAIRAAGPAGDYLTLPHTRSHMRQLWRPRFMDRRPYGQFEEAGDTARDWARERAREILRTHRPDPLEDGISAELDRIIVAVEASGEGEPG
ncbi:MAG: trimethylamine methyltransferase family protein [Chloroflexi bacterium]|nr:trimethylamine methyltransferase family protein [Chloroflexota bacterium]